MFKFCALFAALVAAADRVTTAVTSPQAAPESAVQPPEPPEPPEAPLPPTPPAPPPPAKGAKPSVPAKPAKPAAAAKAVQAYTFSSGRPTWEYEFADVPAGLPAFQKLLADKGKQGWEYSGAAAAGTTAKAAAGDTAIFKRPVANAPQSFKFSSPGGFGGAGGAMFPADLADRAAVEKLVEMAKGRAEAAKAQARAAEDAARAAGGGGRDAARPGREARGQTTTRAVRVIQLSTARAEDMAELLNQAAAKGKSAGYRVTADPEANTVTVAGTAADVARAAALVKVVDEPAAPEKP